MFTVKGWIGKDLITVNWVDGRIETPGNEYFRYIEWLAWQKFDVPMPWIMPQVKDKLSDPLAAYIVIRKALDGGVLKTSGDIPEMPVKSPRQKGVYV